MVTGYEFIEHRQPEKPKENVIEFGSIFRCDHFSAEIGEYVEEKNIIHECEIWTLIQILDVFVLL